MMFWMLKIKAFLCSAAKYHLLDESLPKSVFSWRLGEGSLVILFVLFFPTPASLAEAPHLPPLNSAAS